MTMIISILLAALMSARAVAFVADAMISVSLVSVAINLMLSSLMGGECAYPSGKRSCRLSCRIQIMRVMLLRNVRL